MTRHTAVSIDDDFTTSQTSIADRTTDDKFASWVDMIARTSVQ